MWANPATWQAIAQILQCANRTENWKMAREAEYISKAEIVSTTQGECVGEMISSVPGASASGFWAWRPFASRIYCCMVFLTLLRTAPGYYLLSCSWFLGFSSGYEAVIAKQRSGPHLRSNCSFYISAKCSSALSFSEPLLCAVFLPFFLFVFQIFRCQQPKEIMEEVSIAYKKRVIKPYQAATPAKCCSLMRWLTSCVVVSPS